MDKISRCISSFFYVGFSPKAPGTLGSLAALPLAWWVWSFPAWLAWSILFFLLFLGAWSSHRTIKITGKEDNQTIVIDEVVGILAATSVAAPLWWHFLLAFFLFRIFDILKPGPIRWLDQNIKGGWGVMLDDLLAGIIAALVLYLVLLFSPNLLHHTLALAS